MRLSKVVQGGLVALAMATGVAAQAPPAPSGSVRQSMDDAWWTGPILAPGASTLPPGHFLIEPYLYDVTAQGNYDRAGVRHGGPAANGFGSLTYLLYGLTDRVTVGMMPTAGYNQVSAGASSSGVGLGDVTLLAQAGLTRFHAGSWIPTSAVSLQETLPSGKYDRLGDRPSDGLGGGAYTTTLGLYFQEPFWLPNGRIVRLRLDLTQALSRPVNLEDVSVYGTAEGFRGQARPGSSFFADLAGEYSVTRSWVLALDVTYRHQGNTVVNGTTLDPGAQTQPSVLLDTGQSEAFALAPAIEYSWSPNVGVIVGTRLIPAGRNAATSVTPVMAINIFH